MNGKYGSEKYSHEFRDLQATTMSLDPSGQLALLAGRKYLAVVDVAHSNSGAELKVRFPYGGKYEISSTQWSSLNNANIIAVASSQRCDIFELNDSCELKCMYRLKCHSRVITDIDWSRLQPNYLATSSFDSYVHIWDIRVPRQAGTEKPQQSLSALDGASQVRWNKWKTDTLASCDGGHVKIWDMRVPNTPSEYIAAHASKINGLEWGSSDMIITAAQDCTVKFNRIGTEVPMQTKVPCIALTAPVWRARPSPFGRGIVTQCVPILRRDSGLLSLWDSKRCSSPVYTFQAHDIVEFAWKRLPSYDLITWSRDQILRVWTLPAEIIELCGESPASLNRRNSYCSSTDNDGQSEEKGDIVFDEDDDVNLAAGDTVEQLQPNSEHSSLERRSSRRKSSVSTIVKRDELLKKEFDDVASSKPDSVIFDQVEVERGFLRFSWKTDPKGRSIAVVILASFPLSYPAAAPTFLMTSGSSDVDKTQILKALRQTAQQYSRRKEPCLGPCINQFASFMNLMKPLDVPDDFSAFPSRGVSNVPFPRTSGARFCSVGMLICFGRPAYLRRVKSNSDASTPRSLSALGPFLQQLAHDNEEVNSRRRSRRGERKRAGLVTVFDVCPLLPFSRDLAPIYGHIANTANRMNACLENEQKALNMSLPRVAHAWKAAAIVAKYASNNGVTKPPAGNQIACLNPNELSEDEEDANWIQYHPLGSRLINNIIRHFANYGDVQTSATMACLFSTPDQNHSSGGGSSSGHNSLTYVQPAVQNGYGNQTPDFQNRNGSFSPAKNAQPLKQPRLTVPKWWTKGSGSPYHTVHGSDTLHGVVVNPLSDSFFRQHRSNSWSDSLDDSKAIQAIHESVALNGTQGSMTLSQSNSNGGSQSLTNGYSQRPGSGSSSNRNSMLDPSLGQIYDCYKKSYAEILYRWGHLQQRAEVLKCLTEGVDNSSGQKEGVNCLMQCKYCFETVRGPYCLKCKRIVSHCAICHIPVKGLSTYCAACGHGGHSAHMMAWFTMKKYCPTGCGCPCIESVANFI